MPKKKEMYQRPDGLYEAIRIINGKRKAFRGKSPREVEHKMLAYKEDAALGPLFEVAAEAWWEEFSERAAPNSLKGYRPARERAVERFKGKRLTQITAKDIKAWLLELVRKDFAKKTVQTHLIVMNGIYKMAQEEHNMDCNPAALVCVPKGLPQKRRELPSDQDDARMLANIMNHPLGLLPFLAKYTGARRGELLGLRYGDFDREEMTVKIERSVYYAGNHPQLKAPKSEAGIRSVPLMELVDRVLPMGLPDKYLFSDDGGSSPLTQSRFDALWEDYCKATGITATPHQWRHLYSTVLYEAGIEPKDAQKLMGHAQLATTMDIYTHVRDQRLHKAAQKLNKYTENTQLG